MRIAIFLIAIMAMVSCTDSFEGINENPNVPTDVNPRFLLTQVIRSSVNNYLSHNYRFANEAVQYSARNIFGEIQRYEWEPAMSNPFWNGAYNQAANLVDIKSRAESLDHDNFKAVAIILESWLYSTLTDTYGDIPYREAGLGINGINQPVYDSQDEIYTSILSNLKEASEMINPAGKPIAGDILYNNDLNKWKKFANSLRLRLLMRASDKNIGAAAQIQEIINNPNQYPVFTSNNDNAVLQYLESQPNVFPPSVDRASSFEVFKASEFLVNTLKELDDPRLTVFAQPTPNSLANGSPEFVGLPSGLSEAAAAGFNGGDAFQSVIGARFFTANQADAFLMTYPEVQFILAEAAQKDLISGDAEDYYIQAIEASFDYWDVEMPAGYLEQADVTYDESLQKIILQKYLHNYFTGSEAWFDLRRTGYPQLPIGPSVANNQQLPLRMYYPVIEQSLNEENYKEAVSRLGNDDINAKMWLVE